MLHSVVSYRNSTSNHNSASAVTRNIGLYLIEILHQTTTTCAISTKRAGCILSKFYIKPQPRWQPKSATRCCILSKFYIKPQLDGRYVLSPKELYLIEILHQTTTRACVLARKQPLYLIEILHQTTTELNTLTNPPKLYLIEILHQTTTSGLILIDKVLLTGCLPL